MNINIIYLILIVCISKFLNTDCIFFKIRNTSLRLLLLNDIQKSKQFIKTYKTITCDVYNKIVSVYYDGIYNYSSLNEDDKEILDTICSLCC
jgi:hypothetical protein